MVYHMEIRGKKFLGNCYHAIAYSNAYEEYSRLMLLKFKAIGPFHIDAWKISFPLVARVYLHERRKRSAPKKIHSYLAKYKKQF